jgi:hypothetical protein
MEGKNIFLSITVCSLASDLKNQAVFNKQQLIG